MCGRYYVDDETAREIEKMVRNLDRSMRIEKKKDIHPSEPALVLSRAGEELAVDWMNWGFPGYENGKLLINARAEGITEKKTFRDSVLHRRCVIPAKGFYEWNARREKVCFEDQDKHKILYLAGCFRAYQEQNRFVIITTAANETMQPVHHRMPLILDQSEAEDWIMEDSIADRLLQKVPGQLRRFTDYEQMSLF